MPEFPPETPDVSILIVAYNSAQVITACIDSIAMACTRHAYEVLMIDNGDGTTAALVGQAYPQVRIIPGRGNIGFAAGNNCLAAEARAPMLLLANPDLEMHAGAVDALLDGAARHSAAAAWGGVTLNRAGRPDLGNSVHVPSLREMASRLVGRSLARVDASSTFAHDEQVDALSGGFVMFSRQAWDAAGGMDERYFLYCEEVDLFYRLARMGHVFWRIGDARAFHDIGHGAPASRTRQLYLIAGIMEFTRIHWNGYRRFTAFALIWLASLIRYVLGKMAGVLTPKGKELARKHELIALKPGHWRYGYHPSKGLLAKLKRAPL
ncbi:glycosyltransferase family 2 protein [Erythrobacter sp. R86502]|uniref:glycosyltransferase family 2 protein n=1 Tax=Erythrobacter sp. R86502 TaxID=3093846 RepID=UPI0036D34C03